MVISKMQIVAAVVAVVLIVGVISGYFVFYGDDEEDDEEETFELTVDIDGEGSVDIDPEQDEYEEGTDVDLTAEPDDDWEFDEWVGTDETGSEITITMDEDKEITAHFEEDITVEPDEYTLTIDTEGEGTTDPPADTTHTYDEDTDVTVEATPADGWEFNEWKGDVTGTDNVTTVTMEENKSITANFTQEDDEIDPEEYELTIDVEGQGTTEPEEGTHTYDEDEDVTVEAIPADGWEFNEWKGDAAGTDNVTTVTLDENKSITANFTEEDTTDDEVYWNAYDFDSEVETEDGGTAGLFEDDENKTLEGFTYDHNFVDEDGLSRNFTIETDIMERTTIEITVDKYDLSDPMNPEITPVTFNLETYELHHNISVEIEDDEQHPDWIDMTVHIPVENYSTEEVDVPDGVDVPDVSNFLIYSLVEFTDSNGNEGLFSYHLTDDMIDEMNDDDDIYYVPHIEGDFDDVDYDEWVLYGIYGHCWTWFQPFSEDTPIEEGEYNIGGFNFYVENTTVDLSGHTFDGFHIGSEDVTFGPENVHLKGTFVPSLPVPVYLQAGQDGSPASYTMELTEIVLE